MNTYIQKHVSNIILDKNTAFHVRGKKTGYLLKNSSFYGFWHKLFRYITLNLEVCLFLKRANQPGKAVE